LLRPVLAGSDGGINPNRLEISILGCAGGWRAEEFSAGQFTIMDNSGLSNLQPTAVAFATERNNLVSVASQKFIRAVIIGNCDPQDDTDPSGGRAQ
jgi:hypothetical protein